MKSATLFRRSTSLILRTGSVKPAEGEIPTTRLYELRKVIKKTLRNFRKFEISKVSLVQGGSISSTV